jgi:hypothetical protein
MLTTIANAIVEHRLDLKLTAGSMSAEFRLTTSGQYFGRGGQYALTC